MHAKPLVVLSTIPYTITVLFAFAYFSICCQAFQLLNVEFPSATVPSGQITLHGTIVSPSTGSGPFPGVLLIAGSGPNDRWENDGVAHPLYDIATYLADAGFVVLAYDKRTCSAAAHEICSTVFCNSEIETNCVKATLITLYDFESDAQQALMFLKQQTNVMSSNLTVIGHSQGCTLAPRVAAADAGVVNTVLLMGTGVTTDMGLALQSQRQIPLLQAIIQYLQTLSPTPQILDLIAQNNASIGAFQCTANSAVAQFNLMRNGQVSIGNSTIICPIGVSNSMNQVLCPAQCGNGICSPDSPPECLALCQEALRWGGCQLTNFYASWMEMEEPAARVQALSNVKGRILSINSWTDMLVPPSTFEPLHAILNNGLTGTQQYIYGTQGSVASVQVNIFANLTHLMTPYNFYGTTQHTVSPVVLDTLREFLSPTPTAVTGLSSRELGLAIGLGAAGFVVVLLLIGLIISCRNSERKALGEPLLR